MMTRPIFVCACQLEDQNQHLREQNQKCNEQLELLRNRLHQLSQANTNGKNRRASTEVRISRLASGTTVLKKKMFFFGVGGFLGLVARQPGRAAGQRRQSGPGAERLDAGARLGVGADRC